MIAGAVMAEQPDDLARHQVDAGAVDSLDAAEGDRDVAHLDQRLALAGMGITEARRSPRCSSLSPPAQPLAIDPVEPDRDDEDDADDDVLQRRIDADQDHAGLERLHHQSAQHRARDGADAAGKRGAADHRGRDDIELVERPGGPVEALRRAVEMQAEIPTSAPINPKTSMRTLQVFTPENCAASGLPPMAKT